MHTICLLICYCLDTKQDKTYTNNNGKPHGHELSEVKMHFPALAQQVVAQQLLKQRICLLQEFCYGISMEKHEDLVLMFATY